jgi:hypothetical protein
VLLSIFHNNLYFSVWGVTIIKFANEWGLVCTEYWVLKGVVII